MAIQLGTAQFHRWGYETLLGAVVKKAVAGNVQENAGDEENWTPDRVDAYYVVFSRVSCGHELSLDPAEKQGIPPSNCSRRSTMTDGFRRCRLRRRYTSTLDWRLAEVEAEAETSGSPCVI